MDLARVVTNRRTIPGSKENTTGHAGRRMRYQRLTSASRWGRSWYVNHRLAFDRRRERAEGTRKGLSSPVLAWIARRILRCTVKQIEGEGNSGVEGKKRAILSARRNFGGQTPLFAAFRGDPWPIFDFQITRTTRIPANACLVAPNAKVNDLISAKT